MGLLFASPAPPRLAERQTGFPRVIKRRITARTINTAIAIPMLSGVSRALIILGFSGVGVGVSEGAGGGVAFFFASIDCAYCKRWNVSLSCGFTLSAAS